MSRRPPQPAMRFMGSRFDPDNAFGQASIRGRLECPRDCPCEVPNQRLQSQRQPNRLIGELIQRGRIREENHRVREAEF
jgi:hypothetical protein